MLRVLFLFGGASANAETAQWFRNRGHGGSFFSAGSYGYYWSSTFDDGNYAWGLGFSSDDVGTGNVYRYYGFSVRPVSE